MTASHAFTYISGRLVSLVLLLGFQILLVRILPPQEFGPYAFVFALATLMQTVMSFGVPRIISKYVGQAGWAVPNADIRRLLLRMLALRIGGTATLIALAAGIASLFGTLDHIPPALLLSGALYIVIGVVQIDADAAAQALSLQHMSRRCMIGEAALRCALVSALAATGELTAAHILQVSAVTLILAAVLLLIAVLTRLKQADADDASQKLDRAEIISTGINGYTSSLAWFASSPAIIRLIASFVVPINRFAGFSFVQGLVISFQRYTPGSLLFPFVEPVVMRAYHRTGDKHQLESGLSIVSKIDALLIGSAIVGASIAARPVILFMTNGKYGDIAYAIPWLLLYVLTIPIYRSFEITALLLNVGSALRQTLAVSIGWTLIAGLAATQMGLIALLIGPVGDACTRLFLLYRALGEHGIHRAADIPVLSMMLSAMLLFSGIGQILSSWLEAGPIACFNLGLLCSAGYIISILMLRPFRPGEAQVLARSNVGLTKRILPLITRIS